MILPKRKDKNNIRYGFVIPSSSEQAKKIIESIHQTVFKGKRLVVKFAVGGDKDNIDIGSPKRQVNIQKYTRFSQLQAYEDKQDFLNDDKVNHNHRILRLSLKMKTEEELKRSLIAIARNASATLTISKMMESENIKDIKIQGLSTTKFLLTFPTKDPKESMDLGWLDLWFAFFMKLSIET